jgi:hypothetical protein
MGRRLAQHLYALGYGQRHPPRTTPHHSPRRQGREYRTARRRARSGSRGDPSRPADDEPDLAAASPAGGAA